jgi:hypothetical protein
MPKSFVEVVEADVLSVSEDGYTISVRTNDGRPLDVQVASPIFTIGKNTDEGLFGQGMNVCPTEGSPCLVLISSYGQAYLLAFIHPYTSTGYQGNRPPIKQGDIKLNTRSGSFLDILASGIAQIGATDIAKTVYLPQDNSARTIALNYLVSTGLGEMNWRLDEKTRKGSFNLVARSGTPEDSPAGILSLGDNAGGSLVELRTSSGKEASFSIDQKGNVRTDAGKDATCSATSGVIRQDARKIFLNSGASFTKGISAVTGKAFGNNFFQLPNPAALSLPTPALPPGSPSAIFKFPAKIALPTSLGIPDPKRTLQALANPVISSISLPRAPPNPFSGGSSGGGGSGRSF